MSFLLSFHPFKERVNAPAERSRRRPFVAYLRGFVSKRGAKILLVSTKTRKSVKFFLPLLFGVVDQIQKLEVKSFPPKLEKVFTL
jgi:hypothetical protein